MRESIRNYDDILSMLDASLKENSRFNWDSFYSNREMGVPFFVNKPASAGMFGDSALLTALFRKK